MMFFNQSVYIRHEYMFSKVHENMNAMDLQLISIPFGITCYEVLHRKLCCTLLTAML